MTADDIPAAPNPKDFRADEIVLYGIRLNEEHNYAELPIDEGMLVKKSTVALRLSVVRSGADDDEKAINKDLVSVAVVYGYAFEGHCYRLDKPRLLILAPADPPAVAVGCGFAEPYMMWRITSKTTLLDLASSVGQAEDLILGANLPGNRSPNTYGNDMQLAHRGGRLNRGGGM